MNIIYCTDMTLRIYLDVYSCSYLVMASTRGAHIMVADKIKIEKVPTSSVEKTDVLIGFSVVELPKNSLQMLDSGKF